MPKKSSKIVPLYPKKSFLQIYPAFQDLIDPSRFEIQTSHVKDILLKVLPKKIEDLSSCNQWLLKQIPYLFWSKCTKAPCLLSISLFSLPMQKVKTRPFFLDLIRRSLLEEKDLQIASLFNFSFKILEDKNHPFSYSEVNLFIESKEDLEFVNRTLPQLKRQLLLALNSFRFASFLSEGNPGLFSKKISSIFKDLNTILEKRSDLFDEDVFHLLYRFVSLAGNHFCLQRSTRHITRIACYLYFLKRDFYLQMTRDRQLLFNLFSSKICFPFGKKSIISILFVSPVSKNHVLKEYQIEKAIRKYLPNAQLIVGSHIYFLDEDEKQVRFHYLEIEKNNGGLFDLEKIQLLKRNLGEELQCREEDMIPSNIRAISSSEIQNSLFLLSEKIQFLSDPPQVWIYFYEEVQKAWIFKVLIVQIAKNHMIDIPRSFQNEDQSLLFTEEKRQVIEYIHEKHPKKALHYHVICQKEEPFYESDRTCSLYKARAKIFELLQGKMGPVTDYRGGVILKQAKLFDLLKDALIDLSHVQHQFLQKFFYSISPIEIPESICLNHLKTLFFLFFDKEVLSIKEEDSFLYCKVQFQDKDHETYFINKLKKEKILKKSIIHNQFYYKNEFYLGIIIQNQRNKIKNILKKLCKSAIGKETADLQWQ